MITFVPIRRATSFFLLLIIFKWSRRSAWCGSRWAINVNLWAAYAVHLRKKYSSSSRGSLQYGHVLKSMKWCFFLVETSFHFVLLRFLQGGYGLLYFPRGKVCNTPFSQIFVSSLFWMCWFQLYFEYFQWVHSLMVEGMHNLRK